MKRSLFLFAACLAFLPLAVAAISPPPPPVLAVGPHYVQGSNLRQNLPARTDTLWFGGDDGTGTAFEGGVWDWEVATGDPLQGWTSDDVTEDPADYIYRVTADSFLVHGDPCVPIFPPALGQTANVGQIWCGVHEDDADERDFASGMGYGNESAQRAISPRLAVATNEDIDLDFRYFNDTEAGFDYTYVYLNCYDAAGQSLGHYEAERFTGVTGNPTAPATYTGTVPYGSLPAGTEAIELELQFDSDKGWSDEDGLYGTDCGPFGADDVVITVGGTPHAYDFENDAQGWAFSRRPGVGAFMAVWPEAAWGPWIPEDLACRCRIEGNALGFVTEDVPYPLPGFPVGHHEYAYSGVIERGQQVPPDYNGVYVRMAGYFNLQEETGSFVRAGWSIYPYTTDVNPIPHWSPRFGQTSFERTSGPYCTFDAGMARWDLGLPPDGEPIPPDWEKMRFIFETITDCRRFNVPPTVCTDEGQSLGSPIIDRVQIGLTHTPVVPLITLDTGGRFMDGSGQRFPNYLEPGDVGNADIVYNLARQDLTKNVWLADTASITGPVVNGDHPHTWLARFCFKVGRKGPRQEMIPGYAAWKARLAYAGDPEQDFVCVRMDSVEITQGAYKHKYATFFHESEPAFDNRYTDLSSWQEILPDSLWTPGTRLEYRFESRWMDGTEWDVIGPLDFEILPGMRPSGGGEYDVEWPSVLFIAGGDDWEFSGEDYIEEALSGIGLEYDRFDHLGAGCCWGASFSRSYGGTYFNPGGWGNNGFTLDQAKGYRLILLDTATLELGTMYGGDFELLSDWLATTDCGLGEVRRALILSGDEIASIMEDSWWGTGADFLNDVLGTDYVARSYREYNQDPDDCVYLEPAPGALFGPDGGRVSLRGNDCPSMLNYNVLGVYTGVPDVVGNLRFYSVGGVGTNPYVDFAQVIRQKTVSQVANWRSAVHGFALYNLSETGCSEATCSADSACIVGGILDLLAPEIGWMAAGGAPFLAWRYPCENVGVDEADETHLSGPVDYLYPARPNPNRGTATIRFRLAKPGEAALRVYDPAGRCVRTLAEGALPAGEQTRVWDGMDDRGGHLGSGVYWVRLVAGDRYVSSLRMLHLR